MINTKQYTPVGCTNIAHWMPWHGSSGHVPFLYTLNGTLVPYNSADPNICADQVSKMKLWGIDAINVDYYGPGNSPLEAATLEMLAACVAGGLKFSICVDQGAISTASGAAPVTDQYIEVLSFLAGGMMASPDYLKDSKGRALVSFFSEPAGVDWNAVRESLPIPMAFLFEANFTHLQADGAFGWVNLGTTPQDINTASVQSFVSQAAANPTEIAWYPVYPGFDDSIAGWTKNRYMTRGMGKTLRDTLNLLPKTAQYCLFVTWNDHEEGTGLEEGIVVVNA